MPAWLETRLARYNQARCRGNFSSQYVLAAHCEIIRERRSIRGMGGCELKGEVTNL